MTVSHVAAQLQSSAANSVSSSVTVTHVLHSVRDDRQWVINSCGGYAWACRGRAVCACKRAACLLNGVRSVLGLHLPVARGKRWRAFVYVGAAVRA